MDVAKPMLGGKFGVVSKGEEFQIHNLSFHLKTMDETEKQKQGLEKI